MIQVLGFPIAVTLEVLLTQSDVAYKLVIAHGCTLIIICLSLPIVGGSGALGSSFSWLYVPQACVAWKYVGDWLPHGCTIPPVLMHAPFSILLAVRVWLGNMQVIDY